MLNGLRLLAVVPARGGSKGVPLKNIHPLLGRPLLAYTGDIVREVGWFDRAIVSTDDDRIAQAAERAGLAVPFRRPEALSGDRIGDYDVLRQALEAIEALDRVQYDVVVMLQPTCPLRTAEHVRRAVAKLVDGGWDAVWTVSATDLKYHPLKQLKVASDGGMDYWDAAGSAIVARQQLEPVFHRNGAAYAFRRAALLRETTIKPRRTAAELLDEPLVSIDTLDDFDRVEQLLQASGRRSSAG